MRECIAFLVVVPGLSGIPVLGQENDVLDSLALTRLKDFTAARASSENR